MSKTHASYLLAALMCLYALPVSAQQAYVKHTDFVVTDVGGSPVPIQERTVDDIAKDAPDDATYTTARHVLDDHFTWLEQGIVKSTL